MCGRPVSDTDATPVTEPSPPPLPQTTAPAQGRGLRLDQIPVSFSNPIALRVAFLMSLVVMLLTMIPFINMVSPLWWLGAGLNAVLLYRKLTGVSLSVSAGARLGTITGVLASVCLLAIMALAFTFSGNEMLQEMVRRNPQLSQAMSNTPALVMGVAMSVALLFGVVVGICAAGGALGARFANRHGKA